MRDTFPHAIRRQYRQAGFTANVTGRRWRRSWSRRLMIRAIANLQLVMLAAILSFGYWRKRHAGRSTYLDTCLVFFLLILDMTAFAVLRPA